MKKLSVSASMDQYQPYSLRLWGWNGLTVTARAAILPWPAKRTERKAGLLNISNRADVERTRQQKKMSVRKIDRRAQLMMFDIGRVGQ